MTQNSFHLKTLGQDDRQTQDDNENSFSIATVNTRYMVNGSTTNLFFDQPGTYNVSFHQWSVVSPVAPPGTGFSSGMPLSPRAGQVNTANGMTTAVANISTPFSQTNNGYPTPEQLRSFHSDQPNLNQAMVLSASPTHSSAGQRTAEPAVRIEEPSIGQSINMRATGTKRSKKEKDIFN